MDAASGLGSQTIQIKNFPIGVSVMAAHQFLDAIATFSSKSTHHYLCPLAGGIN